jgi:hypothetical protein
MGARDEEGNPEGMPWEFYRWRLAEQYGWTLGEVDALSMGDIHEWMQIEDAKAKRAEVARQEANAKRRR